MLHTHFLPFPELHTERLTLRRIGERDKEDVFRFRSDSIAMQYIDRPLAQTVDDALKLISVIDDLLLAGNGITWGITLKGENRIIGTIGLWRIVKEHYRAEIGYLLHPGYQRRGLMQEALTVVLDYGFSVIRLHSVEANINPDNMASIRLLQKNHFTQEAHFKENYYYDGIFKDTIIYSLLTPFR